MTNEDENAENQYCECGSETYHIKQVLSPETTTWAECTECGRPTGVFGDGQKKQREWHENQG